MCERSTEICQKTAAAVSLRAIALVNIQWADHPDQCIDMQIDLAEAGGCPNPTEYSRFIVTHPHNS
jgi:hypothetical protein